MAMASKMNAPTNIQTVILPVLTCIQTAIALLYEGGLSTPAKQLNRVDN
jgi:hypothetical protein